MKQLYDKAGNKILIDVKRSPDLIPMADLFELICKKLRDSSDEPRVNKETYETKTIDL